MKKKPALLNPFRLSFILIDRAYMLKEFEPGSVFGEYDWEKTARFFRNAFIFACMISLLSFEGIAFTPFAVIGSILSAIAMPITYLSWNKASTIQEFQPVAREVNREFKGLCRKLGVEAKPANDRWGIRQYDFMITKTDDDAAREYARFMYMVATKVAFPELAKKHPQLFNLLHDIAQFQFKLAMYNRLSNDEKFKKFDDFIASAKDCTPRLARGLATIRSKDANEQAFIDFILKQAAFLGYHNGKLKCTSIEGIAKAMFFKAYYDIDSILPSAMVCTKNPELSNCTLFELAGNLPYDCAISAGILNEISRRRIDEQEEAAAILHSSRRATAQPAEAKPTHGRKLAL